MNKKIASLDLGNRNLKLCIGEEDKTGKITILTKLVKNIDSFSDGEIIDYDGFVMEVIEFLKDVFQQMDEDIKNFVLSFSSSSFIAQRAKGRVALSERYVDEEEIKKAILIAKASLASSNHEILYEEPIAYYLDTGIKIRDPLGMEARSLEVDLLVIQTFKASLEKLKKTFKEHNINISLILPNPLPASFVVLSKKDKEMGTILADFGYRIFSLVCFKEGKLVYFQNFKFGFGDILEDLALDFGVNVEELNKTLMELSLVEEKKKRLKVKIGKQSITYQRLIRLFEQKFNSYWKKNGLDEFFKRTKESYKLPGGVYLIGGFYFLEELKSIFRKATGYPTKLGRDLTETLASNETIFLNTLGSIFFYQKTYQPKNLFSRLWERFSDIFFGWF